MESWAKTSMEGFKIDMVEKKLKELLEDKFVWIDVDNIDLYKKAYNKCDDWHYAKGDEYKLCSEMATANMLCSKHIPIWNDGSFTGIKHYFKKVETGL